MKNFIYITMIAPTMLVTPYTHTMQPTAHKTASYYAKLIAKKLTSGTFSTLHWTIAGGYSFFQGIGSAAALYDEDILLKRLQCSNANEPITDFIQSKMRNISSQKIEGVKISPLLDIRGAPMGVLSKNVIISSQTAREINNAIIANDQKTLDKWNGALEHEEGHKRNNDIVWRTITGITMPFITHGSIKIIRNILPIAKKTRSFCGEQLIKIPTAFGKEMITACTTGAIHRHQEQRADNEVTNNTDLLNGLKNVLIDIEKNNVEIINSTPLKKLSPKNLDRLRWVLNFRESHPLSKVRINKIDQRIALLEKE